MQPTKKIILTLIALLTLSPLFAKPQDDMQLTFDKANALYDSGDYQNAVDLYRSIIDAGYDSWELYYNIGNAYYRMKEIGNSILYYEKALKLAPNKGEVKDNLALARSKATDNIEELPKPILQQWGQKINQIATSKGWRVTGLIFFIVTLSVLCLFLIAKNYNTRKWTFVLLVLLTLTTIFSGINAAISTHNASIHNKAIVTDPMIVVKGAPDALSVDKFVLHEGAKVKINERQDNWWLIEISDGKSGWINSGATEI